MTQFKPYIIVNRLIVTKGERVAYDERFKPGVNIIRGRNSSGKSTISDFIFYALGGELTKWKKEASSCTHTYIEVNLSGNVFTLRREVRESSKAGMDIISDTYEEAKNKDITSWLRYPYSATENKESFYQAILKELGIPYSKSEGASSLTLHQLLRLMYVDQMTSLDRLFKFDKFDNSNKRKAIGELLIGLSDLDLYQHRVRLQRLDSELTKKVDEISTLHKFFGNEIKTADAIDMEIKEKESELKVLEARLNSDETVDINSEKSASALLREELRELRIRQQSSENSYSNISLEMIDSDRFIKSLFSRLEALEDSSKTIDALSNIGFKFCPSCFQATNEVAIDHCGLCGSEKPNTETVFDPTFKVRKEIEFQISESNKMISVRQKELARLDAEISELKNEIKTKKSKLDVIEKPIKQVSQRSREILIQIGTISREIQQLGFAKSRFSVLYELYKDRDATQKEFNRLSDIVNGLEAHLEREMTAKKKIISKYSMSIIHADINHEEAFKNAKSIEFDFGEDRVSIDNRVLFSASSMVYLKNAFRLALLQGSCKDNSFLYPRFLLMDNIEDKGMEPQRSHIFQNEIIRVSSEITVPHQIIFTTSMIDENLNDTDYCVGEFYHDGNKSLKIR
ncbi:MAG: AAA family ATPase [Oceanobacter sp.]